MSKPEVATESGDDESREASAARDIHLMLKVKGGDLEAFEELVERHQGAVIGTVAKMLGNASDAHDIAQQVFVRVWKSAERYEPKAKFTTWLFTITRNLVFNESRNRKRRKEVSMEEREEEHHRPVSDATAIGADEELLHAELQEAVSAAIENLPENQRLVVVLRRYEGMPYEEISSVVGVSVSSVKSLLFRARTTLREALQVYLDA